MKCGSHSSLPSPPITGKPCLEKRINEERKCDENIPKEQKLSGCGAGCRVAAASEPASQAQSLFCVFAASHICSLTPAS